MHHAAVAAKHLDPELVKAVLDDWTTAPVPERTRVALRLVHTLTKAPSDLDAAFIQQLVADGLSLHEIRTAATAAVRFALINRAADALDFPVASPVVQARTARMLDFMGRRVGPLPEDPWLDHGGDGVTRAPGLGEALAHFRTAPGELDPAVRSQIEATAAGLWGANRPPVLLDEPLAGFVGRVTAFAWGLDDAAFDEMRAAGWTDDQLFEVVYAAALGSTMARAELLYAALEAYDAGSGPASSELGTR